MPEDFWFFSIGDLVGVILVPISMVSGYLLGKLLKSSLTITLEDNLRSTHNTLFGIVNVFDSYFEFFYKEFEIRFKKFKDLERDFLPSTLIFTMWAGEPVKEILSENQIQKNAEKRSIFNEFVIHIIDETIESLEDAKNNFYEILNSNETINNSLLKNHIIWYFNGTLQYVKSFKRGKHYDAQLNERDQNAKAIIAVIKNKKIIQDGPIKEFIKKWEEYDKS